jgi:hypothetical protein
MSKQITVVLQQNSDGTYPDVLIQHAAGAPPPPPPGNPKASFIVATDGLKATLKDTSTDDGSTINRVIWDYGDNTGSHEGVVGGEVEVDYPADGDYRVTLTALDVSGESNMTKQTVSVKAAGGGTGDGSNIGAWQPDEAAPQAPKDA